MSLINIAMVVSGGQSGADLAGLRAAKRACLQTGGYMPLGWRTEYGPRPNYKEEFELEEWTTYTYEDRTKQNVLVSDGTVIFGRRSPGSNLTEECCRVAGRPCLWVPIPIVSNSYQTSRELIERAQDAFCKWTKEHKIDVLNVSGNRESVNLGIEFRVTDFLETCFGVSAKLVNL